MKTHLFRQGFPYLLSTVIALAGLLGRPAEASETFGQRGQVVIGGSSTVSGGARHEHSYARVSGRNIGELTLAPSVGLFIAKNVLVKVDIGFLMGGETLDATFTVSAAPKVGYNIDLGRGVSLLPSIGGQYGASFSKLQSERYHENIVSALVEAPFYFQLVQHGAIHLGPVVHQRFTEHGATSVGVTGGVMLWL